ncbi:TPA: hypothetical protein DEP21_02320 [Patescibacteria group bacterium]|nr:hypothetical protein [Candidatus Gracilibacteria bacterium]
METIYKSDSITITGLSENTTVEAYVDNGDLYINGTNVGTTGTVQNGSVVKVALESSDEYDTTTLAVLIIGQQSATFKVTTISEDDGDDNNNDSDEDSDDDIGDIISISSSQKIQISALYNVLSDLYTSSKKDEFMTTLKAMIKERIQEMQDDDEDESKIGALQYLYQLIDDDYSEDSSTYTAPNGKKYTITYSSSQ